MALKCKQCKFFTRINGKFGNCACPLIVVGSNKEVCATNALMAVADNEKTSIVVHESFGCVHFDKK